MYKSTGDPLTLLKMTNMTISGAIKNNVTAIEYKKTKKCMSTL